MPLTADALRMRCRRMCEKKQSGRCAVDEQTLSDYKAGGEKREILELALLESISKHGVARSQYKKVKACQTQVCAGASFVSERLTGGVRHQMPSDQRALQQPRS